MTAAEHLERVVDAVAAVPQGVSHADLVAAILEGIRQGRTDLAGVLLDAVVIAYDKTSEALDPSERQRSSTPLHLTTVDKPLRALTYEARRAIDLGATPRSILGSVANGLTGRTNGYVERGAADRMTAAYDDAVRTIRPSVVKSGRDNYLTWPCRDGGHPRCRGGWRAPSGWMPCTCDCHTTSEEN